MVLWESDIQKAIVFTPVEIRSKKGRKTMKKAKTAIYIPNMDADTFEKICQEKGLQFVYVEIPPHGRMGDLDELKEQVIKTKYAYAGASAYGAISNLHKSWGLHDAELMIEAAPAIIPADMEKEEEGYDR